MAVSGWCKDARFIVVALHTLGVAVVGVWVALKFPQNHHAGMAFIPCMLLDFPVTLLISGIVTHLPADLWPGAAYGLSDYFPIVLFVVLGGLQWFGIVSVIRWAVRRKDRSRCRKCGYPLRGLPEPRCPECGTPFDGALLNELHENGS